MYAPFRIAVDQAVLDDLQRRLANARLPTSPEPADWRDGTPPTYLAELVEHWRDRFDWRAQEAALNRFAHFRGPLDGAELHFIHERGRGSRPMPLLLLLAHGWPDSFYRFVKLIPLLTDPAAHGGDPADAFDVVVPSLPGYGFSERTDDTSTYRFGALFHDLMHDLGYERYGAHGGDVGSMVCDQMGRRHTERLIGIHMTDVPKQDSEPGDPSAAERRHLDRMAAFRKDGGGYMHIQGTRPWTPAAALYDSPSGLAAWIVEKFQAWSDCGDDVESRYSKDELLTNVMIYWVTQSIGTSFLTYRDNAKPGLVRQGVEIAKDWLGGKRVPFGFAIFPEDIGAPPRGYAERFYDVQHWTEMPAGGHFAALEEPERLAADIRAFFRPLRAAD